jgi:hypothetical protein
MDIFLPGVENSIIGNDVDSLNGPEMRLDRNGVCKFEQSKHNMQGRLISYKVRLKEWL